MAARNPALTALLRALRCEPWDIARVLRRHANSLTLADLGSLATDQALRFMTLARLMESASTPAAQRKPAPTRRKATSRPKTAAPGNEAWTRKDPGRLLAVVRREPPDQDDGTLEFAREAVMFVLQNTRVPLSTREIAATLNASIPTVLGALRRLKSDIVIVGRGTTTRYFVKHGPRRTPAAPARTPRPRPRRTGSRAFIFA